MQINAGVAVAVQPACQLQAKARNGHSRANRTVYIGIVSNLFQINETIET
jgi:hypothetical protein